MLHPKDVFYQASSKSWSPTEVHKYLESNKGCSPDDIKGVLMSDLQNVLEKKRCAQVVGETIQKGFELAFRTIRKVASGGATQPSPSGGTQQATFAARTYEQSTSGIVSHESAKRKFSFIPPTLTSSISTNKPRVGSTETQVLEPLFIIKINGKEDSTTPDEINSQYIRSMQMNHQEASQLLRLSGVNIAYSLV